MPVLNQSVAVTRVFWLGSGLSGSWALKISKNGATFVGPSLGTVTSLGNGFYAVSLSSTDTNTLGDLAYYFSGGTGTATQPQSDQVLSSPLGLVSSNGSATLQFGSLTVTNASGPAISLSGTSSGVSIAASAGPGLSATGTTFGAQIVASAGSGIFVTGSGYGLVVTGQTTGASITGITANGIEVTGTAGIGVEVKGKAGYGLFASGSTTGAFITGAAGDGIDVTGTGGKGISVTGTAGAGISVTGSTDGIDVTGTGGKGISVTGTAGAGISATGSTDGIDVTGTAGDGVSVNGSVNAINLISGSGNGINYNGTDLLTAVANALLHSPNGVETGFTPQQAWRLMLSALCSLTTVAGAVRTFRDVNNTVNRIVATTDILGQRLTVTLTP